MGNNKLRVGIFSRDRIDHYTWLINLLKGPRFQSVVNEVSPVYVGNNLIDFMNNVAQCTFAILYHTQKRGRLNVTDVTDSLYDDELKTLSSMLGKPMVIVVLDDLKDSSDARKEDILESQPKIKEYSCALFLISEREKEAFIPGGSAGSDLEWTEAHTSITAKIDHIMKIMGKSSPSHKRTQKNQAFHDEAKGSTINRGCLWRWCCCSCCKEKAQKSQALYDEAKGSNKHGEHCWWCRCCCWLWCSSQCCPCCPCCRCDPNTLKEEKAKILNEEPEQSNFLPESPVLDQPSRQENTVPTTRSWEQNDYTQHVASQYNDQEEKIATDPPSPGTVMWDSQANENSLNLFEHSNPTSPINIEQEQWQVPDKNHSGTLLSLQNKQEKKNDTQVSTTQAASDTLVPTTVQVELQANETSLYPSETSNPPSPANVEQEQGVWTDTNPSGSSLSSQNEKQEKKDNTQISITQAAIDPPLPIKDKFEIQAKRTSLHLSENSSQTSPINMEQEQGQGTDKYNSGSLLSSQNQEKTNNTQVSTTKAATDPLVLIAVQGELQANETSLYSSETSNPPSPANVEQEQGIGTDTNPSGSSLSSQNEKQEMKNDTQMSTTQAATDPPLPIKDKLEMQANVTSLHLPENSSQTSLINMEKGQGIDKNTSDSLLYSQNKEQEKTNDTQVSTTKAVTDPLVPTTDQGESQANENSLHPSKTLNPPSPANVEQEQGIGTDTNPSGSSLSSQNEKQEKKDDTQISTTYAATYPPLPIKDKLEMQANGTSLHLSENSSQTSPINMEQGQGTDKYISDSLLSSQNKEQEKMNDTQVSTTQAVTNPLVPTTVQGESQANETSLHPSETSNPPSPANVEQEQGTGTDTNPSGSSLSSQNEKQEKKDNTQISTIHAATDPSLAIKDKLEMQANVTSLHLSKTSNPPSPANVEQEQGIGTGTNPSGSSLSSQNEKQENKNDTQMSTTQAATDPVKLELQANETLELQANETLELHSKETMELQANETLELQANETLELHSKETLELQANETLEFQANETLELQANETLELHSKETMELQANETLELQANETLELQANETLELHSKETLELQANETLEFQANETLELQANETLELQANETLELQANETLELQANETLELQANKTSLYTSESSNQPSPTNVELKQEQGKGAETNPSAALLSSQNREQEKKNDPEISANTPTTTELLLPTKEEEGMEVL
uniref:Uncharacterized LOC116407753 n=1 Tax=Xenopus tropicalis TaxID=8364 RepID=A0A803JJ05_XENTR